MVSTLNNFSAAFSRESIFFSSSFSRFFSCMFFPFRWFFFRISSSSILALWFSISESDYFSFLIDFWIEIHVLIQFHIWFQSLGRNLSLSHFPPNLRVWDSNSNPILISLSDHLQFVRVDFDSFNFSWVSVLRFLFLHLVFRIQFQCLGFRFFFSIWSQSIVWFIHLNFIFLLVLFPNRRVLDWLMLVMRLWIQFCFETECCLLTLVLCLVLDLIWIHLDSSPSICFEVWVRLRRRWLVDEIVVARVVL